MAARRRVGSESSETRDRLLDCVEQLMLDEGYAAVTYRVVASEAGVTPGLVQYYFPSLDDLFLAAIRRYTDRNLGALTRILEDHDDQVRRALWNYSRDESTAALVMEYMALGNHRKSIRAEIARVTDQVQQIQLAALEKTHGKQGAGEAVDPSAPALLFLLTGIPKLMQLFEGLGLSMGHRDVVKLVERYLDQVEPREVKGKR